jgi:hypothetical protein
MELHVYKNTTVKEVRAQFSRYFPFLKLDFFVYRHHTEEDFDLNKKVFEGLYVDETSEFFKEGAIYFSASTMIAELEQAFQIELGLAAKVFRKSIDSWIDTTQTSHLSLTKQNNMGAAVARAHVNLNTLFL